MHSGTLRCLVCLISNDVSEEHALSMFTVEEKTMQETRVKQTEIIALATSVDLQWTTRHIITGDKNLEYSV
jgi:hypothetical protein